MKDKPAHRKNKKEEPWELDIDHTILFVGKKNYTLKYFTNGSFKIYASTLKRVEEFFRDDERFIRISKSALINRQYLIRKELNQIKMADGKMYQISRRRLKGVEKKLALKTSKNSKKS